MPPVIDILGVAAVAVIVGYVRVVLFPWKRCPRCRGTKRIGGMGGFKICTRCDKEGKVRRIGAPRGRD
jgi:hypothetical protein